MGKFKRARETIMESEGKVWPGVKGLVNEENDEDRFSIVGSGYKVAQHDEVCDIVEKALVDLKINHNTSHTELNEGARLRIDLRFPDNVLSIAGETLQLWATYDNSYDQSTGLRLEINAYLPVTDTNMYCSEMVSDKLNRYYHRHTKGLEIKMLEGTIVKGVEIFQTEIKKEFEQLVNTPVNALEAKAFIDDILENKKGKVAKKYIVMIQDSLKRYGDRINTAWGLYSLICSIFTREVLSIDLRKNNSREMLSRIKGHRWGTVIKVSSDPLGLGEVFDTLAQKQSDLSVG